MYGALYTALFASAVMALFTRMYEIFLADAFISLALLFGDIHLSLLILLALHHSNLRILSLNSIPNDPQIISEPAINDSTVRKRN